MSKTKINEKTKIQLWTLAAGRCQYRGCNKVLWRDELTMAKMNTAYIAHIVADEPGGPRGDEVRSEQLAKDINNLMLMCDEHHRLIDREDEEGHPESLLLDMKKEHEQRIELVTSILPQKRVHVLMYGANVGKHGTPLCFAEAMQALLPNNYPTGNYPIELGIKNSLEEDKEEFYWQQELRNLEQQFVQKVENIRRNDTIKRFALFGFAPQPLLIRLGTLLSDIYDVEVFQRHREPATWEWQENDNFEGFKIIEPENKGGIPVLNLSLSATITNDRIETVLNQQLSIWTITHNLPNNDFLKSKSILSEFRKTMRLFFDRAKAIHGQGSILSIFPSVPVAAAVELGRVWMPKADMDLIIYDQNKLRTKFIKTIEIK